MLQASAVKSELQNSPNPTPSVTSAIPSLAVTDEALQNTLHTLSARLNTLTNTNLVDAVNLGNTADAISKVVQALAQVKALQWSEARAGS